MIRWAALVPALAAVLTVQACRNPAEKTAGTAGTESKEAAEVRTAEVQGGDFKISVSATGKVTAIREVEVLSKASGEIIDLPFQLGDRVKKGDLLARVDPVNEERNVKKSEAALESAKARLAKARNELELARSGMRKSESDAASAVNIAKTKLEEAKSRFDRQQKLFERKLIPKEDLETLNTALEQAKTDLVRAEAALEDVKSLPFQIAGREQDIKLAEVEVANAEIALDDARKRLADTEILSPMDGIVTERKVELGQVISSPMSSVGGGTKMMIISDLSTLNLVTSVDETDIGGIRMDQGATIATDAYPGEAFDGVVSHIAPVGIATNSVVTFDVKVKVLGEGAAKLKPGMTADVTIVTAESKATRWAMAEAIQEDAEGAFIEVQKGEGKADKVRVETGLTDGLRTEIKSGAETGWKLILREKEGMSDWERGKGTFRPMKDGVRNPFMRRK